MGKKELKPQPTLSSQTLKPVLELHIQMQSITLSLSGSNEGMSGNVMLFRKAGIFFRMCKRKQGKREWKKVGHQEKYPPILFVYLHFPDNPLWVVSQTEATLWERTISLCSDFFTPKNLHAVSFCFFFLRRNWEQNNKHHIDGNWKTQFLCLLSGKSHKIARKEGSAVMSGPDQRKVKEKKPFISHHHCTQNGAL